jgi:hypothetical protein
MYCALEISEILPLSVTQIKEIILKLSGLEETKNKADKHTRSQCVLIKKVPS